MPVESISQVARLSLPHLHTYGIDMAWRGAFASHAFHMNLLRLPKTRHISLPCIHLSYRWAHLCLVCGVCIIALSMPQIHNTFIPSWVRDEAFKIMLPVLSTSNPDSSSSSGTSLANCDYHCPRCPATLLKVMWSVCVSKNVLKSWTKKFRIRMVGDLLTLKLLCLVRTNFAPNYHLLKQIGAQFYKAWPSIKQTQMKKGTINVAILLLFFRLLQPWRTLSTLTNPSIHFSLKVKSSTR